MRHTRVLDEMIEKKNNIILEDVSECMVKDVSTDSLDE